MRIVPHQPSPFKGVSFEIGGFLALGLALVLGLHLSGLPVLLQLLLLVIYGTTALGWLVGRIKYVLKKLGPKQNG